ncbi:MAG: Hsp20/alpha crystallin family protein [bacterium]
MTDILYTLFHLQGNQDWQPPVNVFESEDEFVIEMEVAGIDKEQLRVVFEEGVLSISGTRKRCPQTRSYICCQLEMEYGNFYRYIRFDTPVVETEIDARCDKGILTIHVPKRKIMGRT